ncbi:MAG TPA: hypothetical protein VFT09_09065, partial [Ilumatobacteraceae bacterium]|nr:hypothetical protein [Ilumatobacteraceae bacterium]
MVFLAPRPELFGETPTFWVSDRTVGERAAIRAGGAGEPTPMRFDIADYKSRTDRLHWDDLDLDAFRTD